MLLSVEVLATSWHMFMRRWVELKSRRFLGRVIFMVSVS